MDLMVQNDFSPNDIKFTLPLAAIYGYDTNTQWLLDYEYNCSNYNHNYCIKQYKWYQIFLFVVVTLVKLTNLISQLAKLVKFATLVINISKKYLVSIIINFLWWRYFLLPLDNILTSFIWFKKRLKIWCTISTSNINFLVELYIKECI